jgi:hypothetical protein
MDEVRIAQRQRVRPEFRIGLGSLIVAKRHSAAESNPAALQRTVRVVARSRYRPERRRSRVDRPPSP